MIRVLVAEDHTIVREGIKQLIGMAKDMQVVGEAGNATLVFSTGELQVGGDLIVAAAGGSQGSLRLDGPVAASVTRDLVVGDAGDGSGGKPAGDAARALYADGVRRVRRSRSPTFPSAARKVRRRTSARLRNR